MDARLARLHVRAGLTALGRAELEALAGFASLDGGAPLDTDTLLDLAEVRWRTGDVAGAGEAAAAYLDAGGTAALGYAIAAEATSGLGRPGEARRLAGHALERMDTSLDVLFAGIPRSGVWPTDPADPGEPVAPLFPAAGQAIRPPTRSRPTRAVVSGEAPHRSPSPGSASGHWSPERVEATTHPGATRLSRPSAEAASSSAPGLWDAADAADGATVGGPIALDAGAELSAAREALVAGRTDEAAVRLAVALRLGPSLAPAVLDAAGGVVGPSFDLIRGDAYRLVGHEIEARRAFAAAAAAARPGSARPGPTPPPAATVEPRQATPEPADLRHPPVAPAASDAPEASDAPDAGHREPRPDV